MALQVTGDFAGQKSLLGSEPVWTVEILSHGIMFATREPQFVGQWLAGDGLVAGAPFVAGAAYPTYDTFLRQLDQGGISRITFEQDSLGLSRTGNTSVQIINAGLFSEILSSRDFSGAIIRVRLGFFGQTFQDYLTVFTGTVEEFDATYETFAFDLIDDTLVNSAPTPPQFGSDFFPRSQTVGVGIPIVLGDVDLVPATKIIDAVESTLLEEFLSLDDFFTIPDVTAPFPPSGEVTISPANAAPEVVQYTNVTTTVVGQQQALRFSGLTRTAPQLNAAGSKVELSDFKVTYVMGFAGDDIRRVRLTGGAHPTANPFTVRTIPVSPTGQDHRQVHILETDVAQDDVTMTVSGAGRGPNLIRNGEGAISPTTFGWTIVAGAWTAITPSGESEPVIRGRVEASQAIPSEIYQDVATDDGEIYRLAFTLRLDNTAPPPFATVRVGVPGNQSAVFNFGEPDNTLDEQGFDLTFIAPAGGTTRVTLIVDNNGPDQPDNAFFDHIHLYKVSSENPATQIERLVQDHIPSISTNQASFDAARAIWAENGERCAGVISTSEEAQSLLGRIAWQFRAKTHLGEDGQQRIKVFNNSEPPAFRVTEALVDKNTMHVSLEPEEKVYSRYFVYFNRRADINTGDLGGRDSYQGVLFATPEETNSIDDGALQVLCKQARDELRSNQTLEVYADMIPDAKTADRLLSHIVRIHTHRRYIATFTTWINLIDMEIGDIVLMQHSLLPSSANNVTYEVLEKEINPSGFTVSYKVAEIRQSQFNSFIETWDPPRLVVPAPIIIENWDPPPAPQLATVDEFGNPLVCNPFIETWDAFVTLFDERLNAWISDDDFGGSPRALTEELSAAHDFNILSTPTSLRNPLPASNLLPNSYAGIFDAADVFGPYLTPGTGGNLVIGGGPNGQNAIFFEHNPGVSESPMRTGNAQFSMELDWSINIWVNMFTKGSEHRPILINQDHDLQHEDQNLGTTILVGDDDTVMPYILYYDHLVDRIRFCVSNNTTDTHSLHGDAWVATFPAANIVTANTFGSPPTNTWFMVTVTFDSATDTMSISVNDGAADSVVVPAGEGNPTLIQGRFALQFRGIDGGEVIGGSTNHRFQSSNTLMGLNGRIAMIHYWVRQLTGGERTTLYNSGNGLAYPYV